MKCRKPSGKSCPCCDRAADLLEKALENLIVLGHRLAKADPGAVDAWHKVLGSPEVYRMATRVLGRDALLPLDDLMQGGD